MGVAQGLDSMLLEDFSSLNDPEEKQQKSQAKAPDALTMVKAEHIKHQYLPQAKERAALICSSSRFRNIS